MPDSTNIPEEIIAAACQAHHQLGITQTVLPPCDERIWPIVQALLAERMAERERCAKIADDFVTHKRRNPDDKLVHELTATDIASAIREQTP